MPASGRAEPPFPTIGIVGLGLVGGSVGLAARRQWPGVRVVGLDRREIQREAISAGAVTDVAGDIAALAREANLVVLAAPVAQNLALLADLAPLVRPTTVVTDVGSTKRGIVAAGVELPQLTFIGGHPVSGAATSGIAAARDHLFRGRPWILTPLESAPHEALAVLQRFVQGLGAQPSILTADAHDRLMAFVSHLPQVTASALLHTVGTAVGESGLALSGPGLADTTRLAASPPGIWTEILASNADHVEIALDALEHELAAVRQSLHAAERIPELFTSAGGWRRALRILGEAAPPPARRLTDAESTREIPAVRTYLEMLERPRSERRLPDGYRLEHAQRCPPSLFRFLYIEVGRAWNWLERLPWSDEKIAQYLAQPGLELRVLTHDGIPDGYLELHRRDGDTEIVYFGLMPHAIGQGLGAAFLSEGIARAWHKGTRRVWLHTCTLDHRHALANYLARGFRVVREEPYTARIAVSPAR